MTSASPQADATAAQRAKHAAARETLPLRVQGAQGPSFPCAEMEARRVGLGETRAGDDAEGRCGPETAVSTVHWRGAGVRLVRGRGSGSRRRPCRRG